MGEGPLHAHLLSCDFGRAPDRGTHPQAVAGGAGPAHVTLGRGGVSLAPAHRFAVALTSNYHGAKLADSEKIKK